ncbi:hypothetical protein Fmac_022587 [Flemingia macrophylla]|uniref:Uncharacterized protein n=1 Tax=Flemingia macrophylla TaxID=520843 RepID=A0ABD1M053_9FABA
MRGRPMKRKARKRDKLDLNDLQWTSNIPECPVYYPSVQEFEDPLLYLQTIVPEASKFGICKIVSPIVASIPADIVLTKEKEDFKFQTSVQPLRLSEWNEKDKMSFSTGRNYTFHEFEALAEEAFLGKVEYGINVEDSAFSCDPDDKLGKSKWNLKNFSRLPQSALRLVDKKIPGVTDPMLYIGMLFSMFAWHVEDHYLYSINYHHSGANKTWYGVPGQAASQFENVVFNHVYCNKILSKHGEDGALKLLSHKTTMFPPNILVQNDVAVYKAVQKPGEFIISFPRAYHSGFSSGFNCGEAVNFTIGDWFPLGAASSKRYARLKVFPLISYEELLCKEAMEIYKSLKVIGSNNKANDLISYHATALSFMHLMQFYKETLLRLEGSKESSIVTSTLTCRNCHRDCYVAYMLCEHCYSDPICLYHDIESHKCSCGETYTIFKRDDMLEMEDAAKRFEQEEDIRFIVHKKMDCGYRDKLSLSCILNECMQDVQGVKI